MGALVEATVGVGARQIAIFFHTNLGAGIGVGAIQHTSRLSTDWHSGEDLSVSPAKQESNLHIPMAFEQSFILGAGVGVRAVVGEARHW